MVLDAQAAQLFYDPTLDSWYQVYLSNPELLTLFSNLHLQGHIVFVAPFGTVHTVGNTRQP